MNNQINNKFKAFLWVTFALIMVELVVTIIPAYNVAHLASIIAIACICFVLQMLTLVLPFGLFSYKDNGNINKRNFNASLGLQIVSIIFQMVIIIMTAIGFVEGSHNHYAPICGFTDMGLVIVNSIAFWIPIVVTTLGLFKLKDVKIKNMQISDKGKRNYLTLVLIFIFLGLFGGHSMYAGKKTYGIVTLVLTIFGIGIVIFLIPHIVDMVRILCHTYKDKAGNIITDLK